MTHRQCGDSQSNRGVGRRKGAKGHQMGTERDCLGNEYMMQCAGDVLLSHTCTVLLTNVTPIHLSKFKKL